MIWRASERVPTASGTPASRPHSTPATATCGRHRLTRDMLICRRRCAMTITGRIWQERWLRRSPTLFSPALPTELRSCPASPKPQIAWNVFSLACLSCRWSLCPLRLREARARPSPRPDYWLVGTSHPHQPIRREPIPPDEQQMSKISGAQCRSLLPAWRVEVLPRGRSEGCAPARQKRWS